MGPRPDREYWVHEYRNEALRQELLPIGKSDSAVRAAGDPEEIYSAQVHGGCPNYEHGHCQAGSPNGSGVQVSRACRSFWSLTHYWHKLETNQSDPDDQ